MSYPRDQGRGIEEATMIYPRDQGRGIEEARMSYPRDQAMPICSHFGIWHHDGIKHGKITFQDPVKIPLVISKFTLEELIPS